jgi:hypothetical protein
VPCFLVNALLDCFVVCVPRMLWHCELLGQAWQENRRGWSFRDVNVTTDKTHFSKTRLPMMN